MNSIDKLTELFKSFPGIGPRQARRFVYYLLSRNKSYSEDLIKAIENLGTEISQCSKCQRFFVKNGNNLKECSICRDDSRDSSLLMILPRDVDLESVEKSGSYRGLYFVLGGVVPILEKEPQKRIRIDALKNRIKDGLKNGLTEIILAMNTNNDGESTALYLREQLSPIYQGEGLVISELGRGLSTGAELEYADPETLKNAMMHRTK